VRLSCGPTRTLRRRRQEVGCAESRSSLELVQLMLEPNTDLFDRLEILVPCRTIVARLGSLQ
jgi:hypothetical protein